MLIIGCAIMIGILGAYTFTSEDKRPQYKAPRQLW